MNKKLISRALLLCLGLFLLSTEAVMATESSTTSEVEIQLTPADGRFAGFVILGVLTTLIPFYGLLSCCGCCFGFGYLIKNALRKATPGA